MNQIIYVASPESQTIHVWKMDQRGVLTLVQIVDTPGQAQPMCIHPNNTHLYVGLRPNFGVLCYHIHEQGFLKELEITPQPFCPTYLTTDLYGTTLYCASYRAHGLSVSPINKYGISSFPKQILEKLYNCHSVNIDTTKHIAWVSCMGEDCIRCYVISKSGCLTPLTRNDIYVQSSSGPRHMTFHFQRKYGYSINEFMGTVDVINIQNTYIGPRVIQTVSMMPASFTSRPWSSDIHITLNNKWLYCSDRAANIISWFKVSSDGSRLDLSGYCDTEMQPRSFSLDSQGKFLVAAGQNSHCISVYSIQNESGKLNLLARYAVGKGPTWVLVRN